VVFNQEMIYMSDITADQARANSDSITYGADEIVARISRSIEANSKTGATSVTHLFHKHAVGEYELEIAVADLETRGFLVEHLAGTDERYAIRVSW
jgi:hypothetical protein